MKIDSANWSEFFKTFTDRNKGRATRLEILGEIGAQTEANGFPFLGVDVDANGSENPKIQIILGGLTASDSRHLTHVVTDPSEVYVHVADEGHEEAMEVVGRDGTKALIRFTELPQLES